MVEQSYTETNDAVGGRGSLLLVDDEPSIQHLLYRGLSMAGYDCVAASNVAEAEQHLAERHFDLVVLDVTMPERSGIDWLPELRHKYTETGVLMLTGERDVSFAVRAMSEGAQDYAIKPVSLPDLVVRVAAALSRNTNLLENKVYTRKLEVTVEKLSGQLEQREREMEALRNLFASQEGRDDSTRRAFVQLQGALANFKSELDSMVGVVGVSVAGNGNSHE